jgi:hypothetical protein
MAARLIDADLGGSVYKKPIFMPGRGKRGGARIILGSNLGDRWFFRFFLFGLENNDRATIDSRELAALQKIAAALLALDTTALDCSVTEGELKEICNEEDPPAI